MDIRTHEIRNITITPEILKLIAEIDEFKGRWQVMESIAREKLTTLRRIATIESVGSSTRIEGAKLTDRQVEKLLSGVKAKSFASRDEQEVAGYADAMDMVSESFESITITENHIKQLHGVLLKYSSKDQEHLPSCSGFSSGSNINRNLRPWTGIDQLLVCYDPGSWGPAPVHISLAALSRWQRGRSSSSSSSPRRHA